ncbi:uncharacterized protein BDZ99DRAFT_460534 [Mytilinidion resinicola]|uniref:Uncharacterized protein n=1 Tax=Mytilinidion resinicola TaxID=574789 RepID=A0A6A6YXN4_9PEZI|nr:uncharacterized protein BDZ99DRAFT_460534 [Mytilinidion resinicola]KAF2813259.1 hypothetical protein BDZ99DRAFT_460534 [Mytilinidion resinicola]
MSDADGDSQMHSSPEVDVDDDEMFPDEADGPSTPTRPTSGSQLPASELSPPNSQGPSNLGGREDLLSTFNHSPSTLNENGKRVLNATPASGMPKFAATGSGEHQHKPSGYTWDKAEDEPGYAWLNKRAMEEYYRASEQIVDKNAMIRNKYGDPLDTKSSARKGGS